MTNLKKSLALVLSCAMFTLCFPFTASAADETFTYTDESDTVYTYTVDDGEAVITKIETSCSNLEIPETVNGYTVTELGYNCCWDNQKIKTLTVPSSVKEIGEEAFAECSYIKELYLNEGLETIGECAFFKCERLTEVVIPETVTTLESGCFSQCTSLEKVTIPDGVTTIGGAAFAYCENLTELVWSQNTEDVSYHAFYMTPYEDIISGENDYTLTNNGKNFYKYSGTDIEFAIPDGVTSISASAFKDSTVESIIVPATVTSISDNAFYNAKNLKSVTFLGDITYIGKAAFENTAIEEITLPDTLEGIGNYAFKNCENLKSITIPARVRAIGQQAFLNNSSLKSVTFLTSSLDSAGMGIFYECPNLTTVTLPSMFSVSGSLSMFENDGESVATLNYSGELTETIYEIFADSQCMEQFYDEDGFIIINGSLKSYNGAGKNVVVPEGVTNIGKAFMESDIETITFPSTLETIDEWAFLNSALTEVTIPSTVVKIEMGTFMSCHDLKKVVIEDGVKQIGAQAFMDCPKLSDVTVPSGTYVAPSAFEDTPYAAGATDTEGGSSGTKTPTELQTIAEPSQLTVTTNGGDIGVTFDGKPIEFTDANPFIDENDRTQAPVRAIAEALGCTVEWDGETQTATITGADTVIAITIGNSTITVNGESAAIDTAARIVNDRTYIPVRALAEALGAAVTWDTE